MDARKKAGTAMLKATWLVATMLLVVLDTGQLVWAADAYTDPDGHFSFTPPDGYEEISMQQVGQAVKAGSDALGVSGATNSIVVAYRTPLRTANANVGVIPAPSANLTVDDVTMAERDTLGSIDAVTIDLQDTQETMLGDEPARSFEYALTVNGLDLLGKQTLALHNGNIYFVTFTALAESADQTFGEMQSIVDTFMFLD